MVCCLPVASHTEYPEIDPIILSGTLALSRFQALSLSQPGPAAHKPRTFELPDEEFCEVARVDELPERGNLTPPAASEPTTRWLTIFFSFDCRRPPSSPPSSTPIERKKNSQPSCCRFRGRRRCQIAPGKRIRGATHYALTWGDLTPPAASEPTTRWLTIFFSFDCRRPPSSKKKK
jgi:hypothetical protein